MTQEEQERVRVYRGFDTQTLKRLEIGIEKVIKAKEDPNNYLKLEDNLIAIRQTIAERTQS